MSTSSLDNFVKQKKEVKKFLAQKLSFNNKKPLLGIVLDKELSPKLEETLKKILDGTAHIDVQVVILADTNLRIFSVPHTVVLPYSRNNRKVVLQACDITLGFAFSDVEEMLLNGTIPVSPARFEVTDYNPNRETGNAFVYKNDDHWCIFAALVRALETFKFPYDWNNIVRQGLETVLLKQ